MNGRLSITPVVNPSGDKWTRFYTLTQDFVYGDFAVPEGFTFDGASVPWIAWQLIGTPFHPEFMRASVLHDWIYHTHEIDRNATDSLYHKVLLEDFVGNRQAMVMYLACAIFGGPYWENDETDLAFIERMRHSVIERGKDPAKYGL